MRHRARSILAASAFVFGTTLAALPAAAQAQPGAADRSAADEVRVYDADITKEQVPLVLAAGQDAHELSERAPETGTAKVELFLTGGQAKELAAQGITLAERKVPAKAAARSLAAGDGVFRPYSGKGGLQEEILRTAQENPGLTKVVSIGKTVQGKDILALKVSKNAKKTRDGGKPSTLFMSNQHAREWITPEMTRRLMHHTLDNYGKDPRITKLVDSTELWFLLSANPDGYDYTFAPDGQRLWRKNLRDNNADGKITTGDGVDLNRNFAYKWGYDNEGSSPNESSETYRGTKAASEPETVALDTFQKRIGFDYAINYHSAAELILYGVGWQVATPTPDDVAYKALAGTPENPAVPGYYPQVSSELYTTNGEADSQAANANGIMMFTPEMTTCQTASAIDPNDQWKPEDCASGFNFPDDEKLIQAEFAKNIPFALSVAESAEHPDRPKSSLGLTAADFTLDPFTTSYAARGEDQKVAVTARKALKDKELNYRVNGGRTHDEDLEAWKGGEVYGGEDNNWFDEYRAEVEGARPGDKVEVWFTGRDRGKQVSSEHFTYTVAERPRADVLVIAEEGAPAQHAQEYVDALKANGKSAAVWDVAVQGAPHHLGALSHFRTAVHYTGAKSPGGDTQLAVRDYLNEGGKLIEAGELAGGNAQVGRAVTNDFSQYFLGAYGRAGVTGPTGFTGAGSLTGVNGALGNATGNPLDRPGSYTVTSDTLPAAQFPQFKSAQAGQYAGVVNPYAPYAGASMASATHADDDWKRLTRTIDLTGVTAADQPKLKMALNWNTEEGYDHAVLESRTAGGDDWTTLPEASGLTTTTVPEECGAGFFINGHPFLRRYLTLDAGGCTPQGTSGTWNSFTGASGGWKQVSFDLSMYAGKTVEVSLAYITDPGSGGRGVFADEARVSLGATDQAVEGFESSLGVWSAQGAPAGSPDVPGDWSRSGELFKSYASVTTRDTVLLGFGLEHVPAAADRAVLVGKALRSLNH
ncbi:M14 family zinc carboxypeptidase [Streptomyces sp. NBC_00193]|uniref:M14 family metallopeptidase n=1 Tax=unclassified Streptomyces TaxID=2593676 RepID=UPI00224EAA0C|nr:MULTISPECIES: M14 family metallopeptidase [unclassified Streptomyces]MCX5125049.1 M14 family zinc carboxypeptidase [Streptomyces sp. NBC_00347]MCX5299132.1 M14 family zinc carboxypeptidase [Streptomyces sp. NBC_00193]